MKYVLNKKKLIGSWSTSPDNIIFEILLSFNFDFHVIDLEHSSITEYQCENLIRLANFKKKNCLVRLTSNTEDQIKKVLDAGANGLILPNIKNNIDLNEVLQRIFYPPLGKRGVGLTRASNFGDNFKKYFNGINKKLNIFVIIENKEALSSFENIIQNKNIQGVMVGPYDLSASLGIAGQFENIIFKNAVKKIQLLSKKYKKQIGFHMVDPNVTKLRKLLNQFDFIIYSTDVLILKNNIEKIFK
ncbi:aldolase/citrate lyase family protein [Alphaproteobacteria bacterium]|jgi:2-dehydro-3-deoxyglucarate aldolase|nr:aldolase/citrate lyase family protein [Alphaproteobacteria bacterium]